MWPVVWGSLRGGCEMKQNRLIMSWAAGHVVLLWCGQRSVWQRSWVGSLSMGMIFFCSPIVSVFTDLLGCRITAVGGAAVGLVGLLASSFIKSLGPLYFTYGVVFACGCSFAYQPSLVILGHYFKRRLGLVNGIVTAGSSVFTVSLPPLLSSLLVRVGLQNTLRVVMCVFMFVLMLAGLTYKPLLPQPVSSGKSAGRCAAFRRVFNVQIWRESRRMFMMCCSFCVSESLSWWSQTGPSERKTLLYECFVVSAFRSYVLVSSSGVERRIEVFLSDWGSFGSDVCVMEGGPAPLRDPSPVFSGLIVFLGPRWASAARCSLSHTRG
ncbi:hypothetical protein MHYP_G00048140 [Metynnis hypsauchen]